jgi:hypothetical protein
MDNTAVIKAIERLRLLDAEETIIKSKINNELEEINVEREALKVGLKEYYYSTQEPKEETKTLRFIKVGDAKLQEKLQEPEFVRDEETLKTWAMRNDCERLIKTKIVESFDWATLKKDIEVIDNKVLLNGVIEVDGVTLKERQPIFEIKY